MKKVLTAWGIWLAWIGITFALAQWIPYTLGAILLIGVPVLFCVLILLGQQSLPLWANIPLLIVQVAVTFPATMYMALIQATKGPPQLFACEYPLLVAKIPIATVGDARYLIPYTCPVPIANNMQYTRPYGAIQMHWQAGFPAGHDSLYLVAWAIDGRLLRIGGPRVEDYDDSIPEFLAEYSDRVTFDGRPETFTIEISRDNGEAIEQLALDYVRQQCTCGKSRL
jgi:hypothetical protein